MEEQGWIDSVEKKAFLGGHTHAFLIKFPKTDAYPNMRAVEDAAVDLVKGFMEENTTEAQYELRVDRVYVGPSTEYRIAQITCIVKS